VFRRDALMQVAILLAPIVIGVVVALLLTL
jgi:hypothetical protein